MLKLQKNRSSAVAVESGALKQTNSFSYEMICKALNACLQTDYGIKLGKVEPETAVEMLIVTRASTL